MACKEDDITATIRVIITIKNRINDLIINSFIAYT